MALVQLSALVSQIAGKLNGSQFMRTRSGLVLQNKCRANNLRTSFRSVNRSAFSFLSRYWHSLTPTEQADNKMACASYPYVDKYGVTRYYASNILLLRSNINRHVIGLQPIRVVPTPPPPATSNTLLAFVASIAGYSGAQLYFLFTTGGVPVGAYTYAFYYSPPVSAGVSNYTGKMFFGGAQDVTNGIYNLYSAGIRGFSAWYIGARIFTEVRVIHNASGVQVGSFFNSSIINN